MHTGIVPESSINIQKRACRAGLIIAAVLAAAFMLLPEMVSAEDEGFKAYKNNEVAEARPKRPVRIKFKRNSDASYSWEIEGESADEIAEADRRLREYTEQAGLKRKK